MSTGEMEKILILGACGQIGSELTLALRKRYGNENVVAADIQGPKTEELKTSGPFERFNVTKREEIEKLVKEYSIDTTFHLAAILSAKGEENPQLAWHVNMQGLHNVLEIGREKSLTRIFHPSSIAAFGPETPREKTPRAAQAVNDRQ